MVMLMEQSSLMAILTEEYGIKSPQELAEAIRRIDERDVKVYNGWRRNRRKRGIDPDWPTPEERSQYFEGRDGV